MVVTHKETVVSRRASYQHRVTQVDSGLLLGLFWFFPGPSCGLFCPRPHPALPRFGFLDTIKIFWEVVRAAENLWAAGNSLWCVIYYVVPNTSWSLSHVGGKCTHSAPRCLGESVRTQSGPPAGLPASAPSLRGHRRSCWPSRVTG